MTNIRIRRLADWLATAIETTGVTQARLATAAKVSPRTITALVNAEQSSDPHLATLEGLERAFGLHEGDLRRVLEGEEVPTPSRLPPAPRPEGDPALEFRVASLEGAVARLQRAVEDLARQVESSTSQRSS